MNKRIQIGVSAFSLLKILLIEQDNSVIRQTLLQLPPSLFPELSQQLRWHRVDLVLRRKLKLNADLLQPSFIRRIERLNAVTVKRSLIALHQLERIRKEFAQLEVRFLVFKGVVLSQLLYSSAVMRSAKDIDILVRPEDVLKAHEILLQLGFRRLTPRFDPGTIEFERYMSRQKDAVYLSSNGDAELELHWRLDINPDTMPIDFDRCWTQRRVIDLNGLKIDSFGWLDTCCHLVMHGSISMWGRLCWLHDWWRLTKLNQDIDWLVFQTEVTTRGLDRMVLLAMLLIEDIFDADIPSPFNTSDADWQTRSIYRLIKLNLSQMKYPTTVSRYTARSMLKSNPAYKLSYLNVSLRMLLAGERKLL